MELRQCSRDHVAIGGALPLDVHVGLHGVTTPNLVAVGELRPRRNHGDGRLMTEARGIRREVAPHELRMLVAGGEHLQVAKAERDTVNAHQQLIGPRGSHWERLRLAATAEVLKARAVEVPAEGARR